MEEKRPSPLLYENSIRGIGPLYEALVDLGADAAICVHVFPAMMMTELRCGYGLRMPTWFVATDFTCSPGVGELQLDGICIPHPALTPEFLAAGLPAQRIFPTGIPIRRQFCQTPDRDAARRQLELEGCRHVFTLACGSMGAGPLRSTAACIAGLLGPEDRLVAVCGSNQRMHRQMIDDFVDNPRVRVLGFTEQMCAYMQASDLLISKAGGLTTAEAVASRTPLLYLNAVPGCESRNIDFMTSRGYALAVESDEELKPLLSGVISGAIVESETLVEYNPDFEATAPLPEKEQKILDLLSRDTEQCVTQLEKNSGLKNVLTVIKSLLDKEAIFVKEELKRNYKPRTEARVRLVNGEADEAYLQRLFNELSRAPKQLMILMKYVELSGWVARGYALKEVTKKELLEKSGGSAAVFNGLVEKKVFEVYHQEIGRLDKGISDTGDINPLNIAQQQAYGNILQCFREKNVCLLHGVTSSGKTEIYIHLIQEVLKTGKQVLYLLPEIALTTQITERLKRVFGHRLGIYHSKFPDAERVEIWQKQLGEKSYDVILGVRSSIFLPFRNLGLVIIDEEHENTYKQQDPAPRYHARSSAIMLASMFKAKVLLGTATPGVETYFNATSGKYGLVELKERYKDIRLPHIELVDIKELAHQKRMQGLLQ